MAENTQTWRSKKDPSKKLTVKLPFFGLAEFADGSGTITRDELQAGYEPEVAAVNPSSIPAQSSDDRIDRLITHVGVLTQRVTDMAAKLDAVHGVVVPPDEEKKS